MIGGYKVGDVLEVREKSNTISRARFTTTLTIIWIDDHDVHYRKAGFGMQMFQTPIERFNEILAKA